MDNYDFYDTDLLVDSWFDEHQNEDTPDEDEEYIDYYAESSLFGWDS